MTLPNDISEEEKPLRRLLMDRMLKDTVLRFRTRNGAAWLRLSAHIIDWADGKDLIVVSGVDISEEVDARTQFKSIMANIPGSVVKYEVDGNTIKQEHLNGDFREMGLDFVKDTEYEVGEAFANIHPEDQRLYFHRRFRLDGSASSTSGPPAHKRARLCLVLHKGEPIQGQRRKAVFQRRYNECKRQDARHFRGGSGEKPIGQRDHIPARRRGRVSLYERLLAAALF
jgi:hypothetical protein